MVCDSWGPGRRRQLQRGGSRIGVAAGPLGRNSAAQHQRRREDLLHPQVMQPNGRAHHIYQRVYAAQFFQLQGLFRLAVDPDFGPPKRLQRPASGLLHAVWKGAGFHRFQQVQRGVPSGVVQRHAQECAPHLAAGFFCCLKAVAVYAKLCQFLAQDFQREASVDQRPKQHIAAGPADGLDVGYPARHGLRHPKRRRLAFASGVGLTIVKRGWARSRR